jgi:hypothetical protein
MLDLRCLAARVVNSILQGALTCLVILGHGQASMVLLVYEARTIPVGPKVLAIAAQTALVQNGK